MSWFILARRKKYWIMNVVIQCVRMTTTLQRAELLLFYWFTFSSPIYCRVSFSANVAEIEAVMFEDKETMLNNKIFKLEKQLTKRDEQIAGLVDLIHDYESLLNRNEEQVTKRFHALSIATSEVYELCAKVMDFTENINLMQIFSSNFDEAEENKRPILSHEGIGMHSQRTPTLWSNVPSDVRERFPMTFVSGYAFPTRSCPTPVFFSGKYEKKRSTVNGEMKHEKKESIDLSLFPSVTIKSQLNGTNFRKVNQENESLENNKLFYMPSFENAKCIQSSQYLENEHDETEKDQMNVECSETKGPLIII
ncbi:unnamed protein product [Schistosoma turkestanicum]|nr:unnamed protein product [Schistosoma turkestanicum]